MPAMAITPNGTPTPTPIFVVRRVDPELDALEVAKAAGGKLIEGIKGTRMEVAALETGSFGLDDDTAVVDNLLDEVTVDLDEVEDRENVLERVEIVVAVAPMVVPTLGSPWNKRVLFRVTQSQGRPSLQQYRSSVVSGHFDIQDGPTRSMKIPSLTSFARSIAWMR